MMCELCQRDIPTNEFGEHIDGHTDTELAHWPGGIAKLMQQVAKSMVAGEGS